ncbi:MAG: ABC transporter substrate-binding protein [Treponema sp.]|nr:ABC transporter substrate-binding protein [Treponema sp.]
MTQNKQQGTLPRGVIIGILAMAAAGLLLSGCTKRGGKVIAATVNDEGQQVYKVRTWSRLDCSAAPYIIGDRAGFFKEAGLEVVYTGEVASAQRLATVLSGDNDIYSAHPNAIAVAVAGGAPIKGVAIGDHEPGWEITDVNLEHMWWVSHKDGSLQTIEDFNTFPGTIKMQSISRNQCQELMTDMLLDRLGLPKEKLDYILLPDIEGIQSLKQRLVDITTPHPPFFKATEETGIANVLITSRQIAGLEGGTTLYAFTEEFIKNNPEVVKRFVYAIKKADRYNNDNPEISAQWTEEAIGVPVRANHWHARDAKFEDKDIQFWIDGAKKGGAIPPDVNLVTADIAIHDFEVYGAEDYVLTYDDTGNLTIPGPRLAAGN